jgi:hypothetical protein
MNIEYFEDIKSLSYHIGPDDGPTDDDTPGE